MEMYRVMRDIQNRMIIHPWILRADLFRIALLKVIGTKIDENCTAGSSTETTLPFCFVCFKGSGPGKNRPSFNMRHELQSGEQHFPSLY